MDSILHLFLAFASVAVPIQGRLFNATITSNVFVAIAEIDTDLVPVFTPSAGEQIILGETYTIHIDESHSGGIRGIYLCSVIDDTHFYMLDKNGGDLDDPDTISPYYTPLGNGSYKWLVPVVPTGQYVLLPQNNQAVLTPQAAPPP
ncbi:hypothetical protein DL546_001124 [Coniochaeta pulveracea]|uniref:Uncharacterized protein n=1 Tax=Coniochaeta pulveracea TaxID=177199 RepID=A0A420Y5H9_9PEZI|nr:hypothetical protein DL546_001124 [Coniochaeta pulveracea]